MIKLETIINSAEAAARLAENHNLQSNLSRRNFLKILAAEAAGIATANCDLRNDAPPINQEENPKKDATAPRIKIANNEFQKEGERFAIQGYNYIRLAILQNRPWHSNFDPGQYDYERSKTALEKMHADGFNTTRVFISYTGIQGTLTEPGIDSSYMDNFVDFLKLARDSDIRIMIAGQYIPRNYRIDFKAEDLTYNAMFTSRKCIDATKAYWKEVIDYIKSKDADLLNVILSYDVHQELLWSYDEAPFKGLTGPALDNLMIELGRNWMNEISDAIKSFDDGALVTGSINPAMYDGVNKKTAWPLLAIDSSKADFIEVHAYPIFYRDTIEFMDLYFREQYEKLSHSKPFFFGEFGLYKQFCPEPIDATTWVEEVVNVTRELYKSQGLLFWTFDCSEQNSPDTPTKNLWTGMESNEAINTTLKNMKY